MFGHAASLGTHALNVKAFMPRNTRDHSLVEQPPISAALKALRENLGKVLASRKKSEPEFAKLAKIDQKTLWRVLRGPNEPTLETVSKLAKACGLEPWQLLTPDLEPNNPPMLAAQSVRLQALLDNIRNTREAIDGVLEREGNTRPSDL